MTYRELLELLKTLTTAQLDQDVTVFVATEEEYYPVATVAVAADDDVLDLDHIVLEIP
jgi:hypothetical protein